ncbi:MAG: PE family protein [Mycobacterium pseudokansasii]|uniref:PE family protein n=1 Tax=Mycobacterium pseudokansasii TaxID=2341080 RepID=UPI003C6D45A3|nr:PE family protein [Mycobacterium pseudokansasii]
MASIGSAINSASAAAATSTTGVLAAGADEVSAAVTALLTEHALEYQEHSAAAFHSQFVQALNAAGGASASAEAANTSPLQALKHEVLGVVNAPTRALLGRPLIGDGADGGTAVALFGAVGVGGVVGATGSPGANGTDGAGGTAPPGGGRSEYRASSLAVVSAGWCPAVVCRSRG